MRGMIRLAAESMGSVVAVLCADTQASLGVVHSVFKRAFNVLCTDGTLISFSVRGTPNFPSNIVTDCPEGVSLQALGIVPGQQVHCRLGAVAVGEVKIELGGNTYYPALTKGQPTLRQELLPAMLARAGRYARATLHSSTSDAFAESVRHNLGALSLAVKSGSQPELYAHRLLGLGAGLTPAGDDALAGFMVALHFATLAQHGCEHKNQSLTALCERLIAPRRTATTIFSQGMLCCAARGHFTDVAEDLLLALLAGHEDALPALVARQLSIGASSGADQLRGMLVGLSTAMGHGPLLGDL